MTISTRGDRRQILAGGIRAIAGLSGLVLPALSLPARAKILGSGFEGLEGASAQTALGLLQSSRQARFGTGKDVWIWLSSLCPHCQRYFREFPDLTVPGFRVNYIPFILGERETGAVLKVVQNPTQATMLRFMRRELLDAAPVDYNPYYTGPIDYAGSPSVMLSRHYAHMRMVQSVYDGDAGYPTETGLNRMLSTPRTFFRTQKGALLMWGGGFGVKQFNVLRDL